MFTPYESGMYKICVELSRPMPEEFWEYGNPMVRLLDCSHEQRFYFEVEHGIQKYNMTKLAKVEDIEQVDKTINSLVRVLKEMTSELKIQHVGDRIMS